MDHVSLRGALRARTAELHEALDRQVGEFGSVASYADYVAHTHRFRAAVEANLPKSDLWEVTPLTSALVSDLHDLDRQPEPAHPGSVLLSGREGALGVFYVLEGSGVGARLLLRRARDIGMSEEHGARHLALQASDTARWPQFLGILEAAPAAQHDSIIAASLATFRLALETYTQSVS